MAYWIGHFKSIEGHLYTCRIFDRTITEDKSFKFGTSAATLSYERGENKYTPHKAIMCSLDIVTDEDMSGVYSDIPLSNIVVITDEDDTIWFKGYLVPSEWRNDCSPGQKRIVLNATDVIGMLKYHRVNNAMRQVANVADIWQYMLEDADPQLQFVSELPSDEYFSTEVALPANHDELVHSGNWMTYADLVDDVCCYANKTTMIWHGTAYAANIDTYSDVYWLDQAESAVKSSVLDVEIVPSYSLFSFHPTGGEKVYINDIFGRTSIKKCDTASYTVVSNDDQTQHCLIQRVLSTNNPSRDINVESTTAESNLILLNSWGGSQYDNKGDAIAIIKDNINLKPAARHTVFAGQNLRVKCNICINNILPWATSDQEATEHTPAPGSESSYEFVFGSHFGIKIDGVLVYPNEVEFVRPDGAKGFYDVLYTFLDLPANGLMEPVIIKQGNDVVYIKNIEVVSATLEKYNTFNSSFEKTEDITDDFDRLMSVDLPLMFGEVSSHITPEYLAYVNNGSPYIFNSKKASIINQYSHPRRLYTATLPLSGFHPFNKVMIMGYKCTIEGATIDLRNDTVTANMLETWN